MPSELESAALLTIDGGEVRAIDVVNAWPERFTKKSIYALLDRLVVKGLLRAKLKPLPVGKLYRLTASGKRAIKALKVLEG